MYNEILKDWSINGRELLRMKREDFCMLGIWILGNLRLFLEYTDNIANDDILQYQDQVTPTPIIVPNVVVASICHDVNVVSSQLVPSFGALSLVATFGGVLIFFLVNVSTIVDPELRYNRVFRNRLKDVVMSRLNDLYNHKYLKRHHSQTL